MDPLPLLTAVVERCRGRRGLWLEGGPERSALVASHLLGEWPRAITLDTAGPLSRWLRVNQRVLCSWSDSDVLEDLSPADLDALSACDAAACAPLVHDHQLLAIVLVDVAAADRTRVPRAELNHWLPRLAADLAAGRARDAAARRDAAQYRLRQLGTVGELAATVAHEIRNPLAVVRSLVQLTADDDGSQPIPAGWATQMLHEVDRINQTVEGLLSLSRVNPAATTSVELVETAADVMRFVKPFALRHQVTLSLVAKGTPVVQASLHDVRQVIVNLVMNACQACPAGGLCLLEVDVDQDPPGGGQVGRLTVTDTGSGIAADVIGRVFDPFFTTKSDGTGLGLSFCRDVVRRHGGSIEIASDPGRGTAVTVRFPTTVGHGGHPPGR